MTEKPKQKHVGKTKGDLRRRAVKIAKSIIAGKSETQACRDAGYSAAYVHSGKKDITENPVIRATFAQILDKAGVTDDVLADDINRLRKFSKSVIIRGKETDEVVQVEDGQVQLGTVKLAVQLKGHLVDRVQLDLDPISAALEADERGGE